MLFLSLEPVNSNKCIWRKVIFKKRGKVGWTLFNFMSVIMHVFSQCVVLPIFYKCEVHFDICLSTSQY